MAEVWTATREEPSEHNDNPLIIFDVLNQETGETHEEQRCKSALPLMFAMGGCPSQMGVVLMMQPYPWRFLKANDQIYPDGPSIGIDDYHPIEQQKS